MKTNTFKRKAMTTCDFIAALTIASFIAVALVVAVLEQLGKF